MRLLLAFFFLLFGLIAIFYRNPWRLRCLLPTYADSLFQELFFPRQTAPINVIAMVWPSLELSRSHSF